VDQTVAKGSGRVRQSRGGFVADGTGPASHSRAVRILMLADAAAAAWVLPSIRFCLKSRTCVSLTMSLQARSVTQASRLTRRGRSNCRQASGRFNCRRAELNQNRLSVTRQSWINGVAAIQPCPDSGIPPVIPRRAHALNAERQPFARCGLHFDGVKHYCPTHHPAAFFFLIVRAR
jgi:hypothetical protein